MLFRSIAAVPAIGGADISAERIKKMLETQGVVVGINDTYINDFVDNPVYGMPFGQVSGVCDDLFVVRNMTKAVLPKTESFDALILQGLEDSCAHLSIHDAVVIKDQVA